MLLKSFLENYENHHFAEQAVFLAGIIREKQSFQSNRISVLLPLRGFYKNAGQKAFKVIYMAAEEAREIDPENQFDLHVKDTMSDPVRAAKQISVLHRGKVSCIIGPIVTARIAAEASNRLNIAMVA